MSLTNSPRNAGPRETSLLKFERNFRDRGHPEFAEQPSLLTLLLGKSVEIGGCGTGLQHLKKMLIAEISVLNRVLATFQDLCINCPIEIVAAETRFGRTASARPMLPSPAKAKDDGSGTEATGIETVISVADKTVTMAMIGFAPLGLLTLKRWLDPSLNEEFAKSRVISKTSPAELVIPGAIYCKTRFDRP